MQAGVIDLGWKSEETSSYYIIKTTYAKRHA